MPAGPSAGRRRGHAHRRSAAISCGDLSVILKPNSGFPRAGSAPTSPNSEYQTPPFPDSLASNFKPTEIELENAENDDQSPPLRALKSTRVGFSDDVQIIPRPLSMVSSDSASTVRPGHSVSNSMSSVISAGTCSPQAKEKRSNTPNIRSESRPRTAEPTIDRERLTEVDREPKRRGSLPLLIDAVTGSPSVPSTPKSAKRWTFFGHETYSGESSPKSRPTSSASSVKESQRNDTAASSPDMSMRDAPVPSAECSPSRRSSLSKKPAKGKKKVKSWAGSILSRKSRQRSQKQKLSRRSPTPPLRSYSPMDERSGYGISEPEQAVPIKPEVQTDFTNWKPRKLPPQEDSMSPVIDLDAALGPFNTPSSFGDDWESSQRGGGNRKRAMHSAAGLGGFSGPGMHYHRRAESAPEFENPRFGLHRLGSSSTMAMEDVFEEDEDEEWEDAKASSDKESNKQTEDTEEDDTGLGIDIRVSDSDALDTSSYLDINDSSARRGVKRKGSGLSEGDRRHMSSTKSIHSTTSLVEFPIQEESNSPVEILDDSVPPRPDTGTQSSESTPTPPFRPRHGKELAPVDIQPFSLQQPYPTPTSPRSTTQSSFPSPRSPFSYDTQRISTAPSSIKDENAFQSLLLGEPGPELRMSVDDVPSLTSSNSTMWEGAFNPDSTNVRFRDGQRSASFSAASALNSRKRSSMASLSRLISSSHGERSKLSIESRAPAHAEGDKKDKGSKSKRISRLMFWKKPNDSS